MTMLRFSLTYGHGQVATADHPTYADARAWRDDVAHDVMAGALADVLPPNYFADVAECLSSLRLCVLSAPGGGFPMTTTEPAIGAAARKGDLVAYGTTHTYTRQHPAEIVTYETWRVAACESATRAGAVTRLRDHHGSFKLPAGARVNVGPRSAFRVADVVADLGPQRFDSLDQLRAALASYKV